MLTSAGIDIDIGNLDPTFSFPEITTSPKDKHDWKSQVCLEKALRIVQSTTNGSNGGIKLSRESDKDKDEREVGTFHTEKCMEWNLVKTSAMVRPGFSKSNMR